MVTGLPCSLSHRDTSPASAHEPVAEFVMLVTAAEFRSALIHLSVSELLWLVALSRRARTLHNEYFQVRRRAPPLRTVREWTRSDASTEHGFKGTYQPAVFSRPRRARSSPGDGSCESCAREAPPIGWSSRPSRPRPPPAGRPYAVMVAIVARRGSGTSNKNQRAGQPRAQ